MSITREASAIPFSFKEMVMRVNAQLRRYFDLGKKPETDVRTHGALTVSPKHFEAKVNGEKLSLSQKEFKLLDVLTYNANKIFSKQQLIDEVWGIDEYIDENTVAVTVATLREKLEKAGCNNIATASIARFVQYARTGNVKFLIAGFVLIPFFFVGWFADMMSVAITGKYTLLMND